MRSRLAFLPLLALLGAIAGCDDMAMKQAGNPADVNMAANGTEPGEGVYCQAVEQRVSPADCEDLTRADSEVRPGSAAFNVPDPMRRGQTFDVHLVIDRRSPKEIRIVEEPMADESATNESGADPGTPGGPDSNSSGPDSNMSASSEDPSPGNASAGADDPAAPTPGQIVEPLGGTAERFHPKVGRHMRAELVGQGFDIVAKSDASQQIPLGGNATWIWSVTARKGGAQSLTLITVVEGLADGRRFVLARTPTVRTVTVEVSLSDRIWDTLTAAPDWIKAVTAVIAALGGLLAAWYALPWFRRGREEKDRGAGGTDGKEK